MRSLRADQAISPELVVRLAESPPGGVARGGAAQPHRRALAHVRGGAGGRKVSGAIPTIQRLGYALGAAYAGIIANAAGLGQHADGTSASFVATVIFLACLPLAGIGLFATYQFVRTPY
jgi:hypothetical protein